MLLSGGPCSSKLAVIEVIYYPTARFDGKLHHHFFLSIALSSINHRVWWIFYNPNRNFVCEMLFHLKWFTINTARPFFFLLLFTLCNAANVCRCQTFTQHKKHIIKSDKNKLFTMRDMLIGMMMNAHNFPPLKKLKKCRKKLTPIELIWMLCSLFALLSFLSMFRRVRIMGQTFWYMTFLSRKPFSIRYSNVEFAFLRTCKRFIQWSV